MDTALWRARFEGRTHAPIVWPAAPQRPPTAREVAIAELLHGYAEGELAELSIGAHLVRCGVDDDDRASLTLFLDDERRHGALFVEAAARLGGRVRVYRNRVDTLSRLFRPLGFLDLVVICHLVEVAGSSAYRLLRAANRDLPIVRRVLSAVVKDEVLHTAFHGERIREALATASPLRRLRMRAVHLVARRILLTGNRWIAPSKTYELALGMPRESLKAALLRAYDRIYSGDLAALRTG